MDKDIQKILITEEEIKKELENLQKISQKSTKKCSPISYVS